MIASLQHSTLLHQCLTAALFALCLQACSDPDGADFDESRYSPDRAILIGGDAVIDTAREASRNADGFVEARAGQLTLSTSSINFELTDLGVGKSKKELEIVNTGEGNLAVRGLSLIEDDADSAREITPVGEDTIAYFTALRDGKTIYVAPQERFTLSFEWKPINVTPDTAMLTIANDDPNNVNKEVQLNTPMLAPQLSAEARVIFPRVAAGMRGTRITNLVNSGESALWLKDIVLSSQSANDFALTFPAPANLDDEMRDSSTWKPTLAPGESIPMRVVFTPDSDAPSNARVYVTSNDPNMPQTEIALEGNVGTQCIKLGGVIAQEDTSSGLTHKLEFGESQIGRATEKTITVENCSRTQDLTVSSIAMADDGGGFFEILEDSLPEGLDAEGTVISPLKSATFKVAYTPEMEEINAGSLKIVNDDEVNAELTVGLSGKGADNICPTALAEATIVGSTGPPATEVSTIPLKTVQFKGSNSRDPDGMVQRYEWHIISAPIDSSSRFSPGHTVENPTLFIDVAGEYEVELVVYDALGLAGCESPSVTILAVPDADIHGQLSWHTPSDGDQSDTFGTDLDLHYMRPGGDWDNATYDVYWQNPEGDWGIPNDPTDNPSLDIDDTDGRGPENINHDNPQSGLSYAIGAYYYKDNGFGPSYATIRIYIEGQLKFEQRDKYLEKENTFWDVATITWPSKEIFLRDRISTGFPR